MTHRFVIFALLPFICYIAGYFFCAHLLHNHVVNVPPLIGNSLQNGVRLLSQNNLRALVIKEIEDVSIAHGTIIDQIPHPKQNVKEHQVVYLTIATQPTLRTPSLLNQTTEQIVEIAQQQSCNTRLYQLPVQHQIGRSFGQFPTAGNELIPGQSIIVYSAIAEKKLYIWPNLCNKTLSNVQAFLDQYQITPTLLSADHKKITSDSIVIEQRPTPGSFVTHSSLSSLTIQLLLQTRDGQNNDI